MVPGLPYNQGKELLEVFDNHKQYELPIPEVKAMDTLGAGDVFHGAFTNYIIKEYDFRSALKMSFSIAGLSCQFIGAREWTSAFH